MTFQREANIYVKNMISTKIWAIESIVVDEYLSEKHDFFRDLDNREHSCRGLFMWKTWFLQRFGQ